MKISAFAWLALSYFGYYAAYGVFVPFFPIWLKAYDYSAELIGIIVAGSYIFRFLGGIWFPAGIRRVSQLPDALRLLAWGTAVITVVMGITVQYPALLLIGIAAFSMCNSASMPLSDTLATAWQRQIQLDYGKTRLIGSVAFVVGVTVFGNLIGRFGDDKIIWFLTALLGLYGLFQMFTPNPLPLDERKTIKSAVTFRQLLQDKTVLQLLLAASFIQGSHAMYYAYSMLYWAAEGISVQNTSLLWGLAVSAEILLFFFAGKLFKTWKISHLLYFTAIAAMIRWGIVSTTAALPVIALTQLMHALTFALTHYTVMRYISTQPAHYMAKLQGLYSAMANCMAVALLTALSGFLYPINPQFGFIAMICFAAIALFLVPRQADQSLIKAIK